MTRDRSISDAVLVALVLAVIAASACVGTGPRPCRRDDQCDDGDRCVIAAGEEVGVCAAAGGGEGEGEGEGELRNGTADVVRAGGVFACAIDNQRRVQCWGSNGSGQLGRSGTVARDGPPEPIPGLTDVDDLAVGDTHACAIGRLNGGVRDVHCWGSNQEGTLGVGTDVVQPGELVTPELPPGFGLEATSIDADGDNSGGLTCVASTAAGLVQCFGPRLADDVNGRPVAIPALSGSVRVRVTLEGICGISAANVVTCTRIGAPFAAFGCVADVPCEALAGGADFDVESDIACRVEGSARCGGDNTYGVVDPASPARGVVPEASLVANVDDVSTGTHHACAVTGGGVQCWGHALFGATGVVVTELGDEGTAVCSNAPCHGFRDVQLPDDVVDVVQIDTHRTVTCARGRAGAVACWGSLTTAEGDRPFTVRLRG